MDMSHIEWLNPPLLVILPMKLDGQYINWSDRGFALVKSGTPWSKIHFHVVHALAALVLPPFLTCTIPQCSSSMYPVLVSSESRGCGCGHSSIVSCCAGYGKAALKHAKSHSSSAWFCGEYFGCNFITYFNHLKIWYFFISVKKVHCFDVVGVWMINLGGEWEPGNLEFSSCLAASSVALGKA